MSEPSEGVNLNDLELALRGLRPRPETLDREVLMYRAGRASTRGWGWPLATLASTALALGLSIALCIRPAPPIVYVAVPPPQSDAVSASPSSPRTEDTEREAWSRYVQLEEQISLKGLDGLPPPNSAEDKPSSVESLLSPLQ